ncbi:MAG TPA: DoxX family protein [Candidatus Deferrimicrobiaceae bacterium]|jgi:putative oxidoreductase
MDRLASVGLLASRILLSGIFLFAGTNKIFAFGQTQAYMTGKGMQMTALFLVIAILFELGGGLSVLLGFFPRLGALALILFLIPTTIVFHRDFSAAGQAVQFAKNLAIMGGLLAIVAAGGGEFSVRRRRPGA